MKQKGLTAKSRFARLQDGALREAQQWSSLVGDRSPPVPLHELARQLRIQRIEFLEMVSTAGIGPVPGGYVIYINTRAAGASKVDQKQLGIDEESLSCLSPPLRFNIAHELAHVFFYNLAGGNCKSRLLRSNWKKLETSCNHIARVLLLPRQSVLREIGGDVLNVRRLEDVTRRFRVSPEVMIYRLQLPDMQTGMEHPDGGLIAYARKTDDWNLEARFAVGSFARQHWAQPRHDAGDFQLQDLQLSVDIRTILNRKEHVCLDSHVPDGPGLAAPCKIEIRPFHYHPPTALIAVRVTGYSQRTELSSSRSSAPTSGQP